MGHKTTLAVLLAFTLTIIAALGTASLTSTHVRAEMKTELPTEEFLSALYDYPNQIETSTYIAWLGDPKLEHIHNRLRGILAKTGGDEAAEYLSEYYSPFDGTADVIQQHQVNPPFDIKLQVSKTGDPFDQEYYFAQWAEVVSEGGSRYVAYTAEGLLNQRDIYLGVDEDNDGLFEDSLPTGLRDLFPKDVHPAYTNDIDYPCAFSLRIDGDQVAIIHNALQAQVDASESEGFYKNTGYQETTLDIAELRQDSDGDGLTDIFENTVFTDPTNPDTDGDGVSDFLDQTPNVNAAAMEKVERGIARALHFYFAQDFPWGNSSTNENGFDPGHPWDVFLFCVEGAGPVAYSKNKNSYGICYCDNALEFKYLEMSYHYIAFSWPKLKWIDYTLPILEQHLARYPSIKNPSEADLAELADYNSRLIHQSDYRLEFNYPGIGHGVLLTEVNGELYPMSTHLAYID